MSSDYPSQDKRPQGSSLMPPIPYGKLNGSKAASKWNRSMFQGLLIHHDVDSALVIGRKVSRDSLRQMCLDRQISFKTIYEVSNVVWEQVLQDDSRDKRRKMTHISRQDVDFGDSIQGQPIEKSYFYLEIRPDVRPTTKYLWPYDSSSRLHMARHFVEEHHDMVFVDLVPVKGSDQEHDLETGQDEQRPDDDRWKCFQHNVMHISKKYLLLMPWSP